MKEIRLIAFSDRGFALAAKLAGELGGSPVRCHQDITLQQWTQTAFASADALIFVGAVGIAVRAIAPYVTSKISDPAVVAVDEGGQFAVSLLSGHLGGANDLTRTVAKLIGAVPVITTATDVNQVFSVDEWARKQNCTVVNPQQIKKVSSLLLAGESIRIASPWDISGTIPTGIVLSDHACHVRLSLSDVVENSLCLVPKIAVLGVGCKRNTPVEALEGAADAFLRDNQISKKAVCKVCSIDLKQEEPALIQLSRELQVPFETYSAQALRRAEGAFSGSDFVSAVTGVDNVCERSAVLGSDGGPLYLKKTVYHGITLAMALKPFHPTWRWQSE